MSSMIKKKGALSFKPKAPQVRRPIGAPPSIPSSSTPRQSVDRQSQTPVPSVRSAREASHRIEDSPAQTVPLSQQENNETDVDESTRDAPLPSGVSDPQLGDGHGANTDQPNRQQSSEDSRNDRMAQASSVRTSKTGHDPQSVEHVSELEPDDATPQPTNINIHETPQRATSVDIPQHASNTPPPRRESPPVAEMLSIDPSQPPIQSGTTEATKRSTKPKRPAKRRKVVDETSDVRPSIEGRVRKPRRGRSTAEGTDTPKAKVIKRKRRAETPSDAEEQELDHTTVKMADLCKDLRIGRKFSKHAEIKQRDMEAKLRVKLINSDLDVLPASGESDNQGVTVVDNGNLESGGVQMRIVGGQIVIDDRSLVVDRHAEAAALAATEVMEEVEENDFTRITTSGTYMKRERNISWDLTSVEKFYDGLRMFGTDFEMISMMFPDRNRRQIKLKFNKEERAYPDRISRALIGEKVAIDFDEYKTQTGLEYEDVAKIEAEQDMVAAQYEADQEQVRSQMEEAVRQKKASIRGETFNSTTASNPDGKLSALDSAKENDSMSEGGNEGRKASAASRSKKKDAKKKQKGKRNATVGGGEEVEVLGSIEA